VEAEAFDIVEGNMCGTDMRGADAPPRSETLSRTKGLRRNLGDLRPGRAAFGCAGPRREGVESTPSMNGHEESDLPIVATKPTNKAGQPVAELVERRGGTEGNADQHATRRAQYRGSVTRVLGRVRQSIAVTRPRWEPYAGKPHVRICAGGPG